MKRGILSVIFLALIATLAGCGSPASPTFEGGVRAPAPFTHWDRPGSHVALVCGPPAGPVVWHSGRATLKTAACRLNLHEWYTRDSKLAPTSTPTLPPIATPTPAPPPFVIPTPTPRPAPATAPPTPGTCSDPLGDCERYVLALINEHRASVGVPPLTLDATMSGGPGSSCPGAYGHSAAMAESGSIWHVNSSYPAVSFPNGLCASYGSAGENVGYGGAPPIAPMLQMLDQEMWSEPHDPATCASDMDHACNMISPRYSKVGIGIDMSGGFVYLTENFIG